MNFVHVTMLLASPHAYHFKRILSFGEGQLAGGIRWSLGKAKADLSQNLLAAAPGYADIPPKFQPK